MFLIIIAYIGEIFLILLICNENEGQVVELENYLKEKSINYQQAYLFPKNEHYSKKYFQESIDSNNRRTSITFQNYNYYSYFNTCFVNSVFIAASGEIYPCMMLRDFKLGNLENEKLYNIFRKDEYKKFWELSKKKIKKCKNCGFNVGCQDCRAIEYYVNKDIYDINYCNRLK